MNPSVQALITYRLERADELLSDATFLLESNRLRSSVNRLYYAAFQAVSALMVKHNISIKSHAGAKAMFELHFVKTQRVSRQWGKFYALLSDNREESDYGAFTSFEEGEVMLLAAQTEEFINIIKALIYSQ